MSEEVNRALSQLDSKMDMLAMKIDELTTNNQWEIIEFSKSTYNMLNIEPYQCGKQIDNHIEAMEHADLTIALNYESEKLMDKLKNQKTLLDKFESTNHIIIDVPKKTNREDWENIANTIESACRNL